MREILRRMDSVPRYYFERSSLGFVSRKVLWQLTQLLVNWWNARAAENGREVLSALVVEVQRRELASEAIRRGMN